MCVDAPRCQSALRRLYALRRCLVYSLSAFKPLVAAHWGFLTCLGPPVVDPAVDLAEAHALLERRRHGREQDAPGPASLLRRPSAFPSHCLSAACAFQLLQPLFARSSLKFLRDHHTRVLLSDWQFVFAVAQCAACCSLSASSSCSAPASALPRPSPLCSRCARSCLEHASSQCAFRFRALAGRCGERRSGRCCHRVQGAPGRQGRPAASQPLGPQSAAAREQGVVAPSLVLSAAAERLSSRQV